MTKQDDKSLSAAESLQQVKALLSRRRRRDAYQLAGQAVVRYGNDPFLLSYFGYLQAAVDGRYRSGIDACTRAITLFERKVLRGEEDAEDSQAGPLYLNLGKAYLAAGKRKEAVKTLNAGLKFNKQDRELMAQLERIGVRKFIPVPFLKRSNPINEFIGRMLRRKKEEDDAW